MLKALSLFAVVSMLAACSSAEGDDEDETPLPDPVVVDASKTTREAIGVAAWGVRSENTSTVVHGYDAHHTPIVSFEFRITHPARLTTFLAMLDVGARHGSMRLESKSGAAVRVLEDTIAADPKSKAVLANMVTDLRNGSPRSTKMTSKSLRFADGLVDGEKKPLIECQEQQLTVAVANSGQTTHDCGSDASSTSCQQGVEKAPGDQDALEPCKNTSCTDAPPPSGGGLAVRKEALTGAGTSSLKWHVDGTDLGIPFSLGKGTAGFLFGDTFDAPGVGGPGWRSPVLLRSSAAPSESVVFDGSGYAPQIIDSPHTGCNGEYTVIPNDGVLLPDGRIVVSYMSVQNWAGLCSETYEGQWRTNHAKLATSTTGDHFTPAPIQFDNDPANLDPYQMQTMQYDLDYVYIYSVRAGRQTGPMMLQRVKYQDILNKGAWECFDPSNNGGSWGKQCNSILPENDFGEPSVRKLDSCVWAMSYLAGGRIVTRTAAKAEGPWSDEHVQVTAAEEPCLYGGFIHPSSTADDLHLMVSAWGDSNGACGHGAKYGVDHFVGHL